MMLKSCLKIAALGAGAASLYLFDSITAPPSKNPTARRSSAPPEPTPPSDEPTNESPIPRSGWKDLNFKVPVEFHRTFKLEAVSRGMSNKELLEVCYRYYLENFRSE
ncbi:hypothetical protein [Segnochrobactrum spirostomi]|uniref:Uncharacterized protein n=1 Tax=Segnochrobactrum spirostomi TaxID=2608987 RepID=A0A6A7Y0B0_9HYPH|nr:hypothetical protein [Segnochrobactrum spirostomi]MQT12026.1 hypothetical protein [Segnochrobactrum spirostomi]